MKISKYFTLEEMLASQTAARLCIDNTPNDDKFINIVETCRRADSVREYLGYPMIVTSGYRSIALNKAIGGSETSSHCKGEAIDFRCPQFGVPKDVFEALMKSGIRFDQLILEYPDSPSAWVHIGFGERMRNQFLIYDGSYRSV